MSGAGWRDRLTGAWLGWRWFRRPAVPRRELWWPRVLAAAVATLVTLLGAALWLGNHDRHDRGQAQEPAPAAGHRAFDWLQTDTPYDGDLWTTIFMGGLRDTGAAQRLAPPGVPTFVPPGEVYVSPAVQDAIAADPLAAGRVPGRVVGTIADAGLQSPDQYLVYAGAAPGRHWHPGGGWGSYDVAVPRVSIPGGPLLGLVGILVGVPALLLIRATGRMSALGRQRSMAASHLLGVPVTLLTTAAGVDAALCATTGAVLGAAVAVVMVLAVHGTTLLGISWFTPGTVLPVGVTVVVWLLLCALVAADAARSTRRDLSDALQSRAGAPARTRRWALVPLAVGGGCLTVVALARILYGPVLPNEWMIVALYVGLPLATVGALAGLPVLLELASRKLRARPQRSTVTFLAVRRLSWRRDAVAASCVALAVVAIATLVGAGAVADLGAMTVRHAEGDTYALQGLDGKELSAALDVDAPLRLLQVTRRAETTDVAECATLRGFVEPTSPDAGRLFAAQCRPGTTFTIVSEGEPGPGRVVLPTGTADLLRDSTVIAADPATASLPAGQRDIIALPGADPDAVQSYVSRVMSRGPQVQVTDLNQDSFAPFVPPTRRQLYTCTLIGLLTAGTLLALSSLDNRRRTRVDDARLVALGAGRRLAARVQALVFAYGAAVAVAIGLAVGTLGAVVYDQVGGLTPGPGRLGVVLGAGSVLVGGAAVLLVWVVNTAQPGGTIVEDLQRE